MCSGLLDVFSLIIIGKKSVIMRLRRQLRKEKLRSSGRG